MKGRSKRMARKGQGRKDKRKEKGKGAKVRTNRRTKGRIQGTGTMFFVNKKEIS